MGEIIDPELDELLEALLRVMSGDLSVRLPVRGVDGIWDAVHAAINMTVEELESALESRQREMTERQRLTAELLSAQDRWRRQVARDLHDGSGQLLMSLGLGLRSVEDRIEDPSVVGAIRQLRDLTDDAMRSLRGIAHGLHDLVLDDLGLTAAIERAAEGLFAAPPVHFRLHTRGLDRGAPLPADLELTLFRVVQEAMTNAARHAQASSVGVVLDRTDERVRAIIEDDGEGAAIDAITGRPHSGGLGVVGMVERAELRGGRLQFEAEPGQGTTVYLEIPL